MPGTLPEGAAIRLGPINGAMGIAEGVETALAAGHRYGCPVWSALNANNLVKWRPPAGVEEVLICGDNDASWTGQAAACELAKRLHALGLLVRVKIPSRPDKNWADETFRRPA